MTQTPPIRLLDMTTQENGYTHGEKVLQFWDGSEWVNVPTVDPFDPDVEKGPE